MKKNIRNLFYIQCENGNILNVFLENNIVAVGWAELGNLKSIKRYDEVKNLFKNYYPSLTDGQQSSKASILFKFLKEIRTGDYIITFDISSKIFYIGEVLSNYKYLLKYPDKPNVKNVQWKYYVEKVSLSQTTKYKLGALRTVFLVNPDAAKEIIAKARLIKKTEKI